MTHLGAHAQGRGVVGTVSLDYTFNSLGYTLGYYSKFTI